MKTIKIFTDGAHSPSNDVGGWAFYIPDLNIRVANKEQVTTNNRMELTAVIKALEFIQDLPYNSFEIYSDSMYVIGGINLGWEKKVNTDLWDEFMFQKNLCSDKNLRFIHIKGHDGNKENEEADRLAVLLRETI